MLTKLEIRICYFCYFQLSIPADYNSDERSTDYEPARKMAPLEPMPPAAASPATAGTTGAAAAAAGAAGFHYLRLKP